jgi:hypothetical protein
VVTPSLAPNRVHSLPNDTLEISIKGKWLKLPALNVGENTLVIHGRWLKLAAIHDEEWLEAEVEKPEMCVATLKEQKSRRLRADIFAFTQKLPGSAPKYRYLTEWSSVAAVKLASFKDWWEKLPQETRKNVRRAQKRGVVVGVRTFDDELVAGISEVNNDSPVRQGIRNAHYGKSLDQVRKDHSAFVDRSDFICAFLGDEIIGFLKLVYRGEVASILNLATKARHSDKRPANALVAKAVELCEARGISFITYGQFNYGNKRDSPLREFKVRNGFEEILKPKFYVPLTRWGALCMKMKLHRGVLGILPNNMIAMGIGARGKWYTLKQFIKPV